MRQESASSTTMSPERPSSNRGQSILEFALFLPILLILIAGMVEIGAYAIDYMNVLDASREGARFGANLDPELTSNYPFDTGGGPEFPDVRPPEIGGPMMVEDFLDICMHGGTTNFYYEVACLTFQNVPTYTMSGLHPAEGDDIVITVIGVTTGTIANRWPLTPTHASPSDQGYHFQGANDGFTNPSCTVTQTTNCRCWSLYGLRTSQLANSDINSRLLSSAPATGFVIVEVFHAHHHFTGFFRIGDFIADPIQIRPYTVFPVAAAEPD